MNNPYLVPLEGILTVYIVNIVGRGLSSKTRVFGSSKWMLLETATGSWRQAMVIGEPTSRSSRMIKTSYILISYKIVNLYNLC